ncbi:pyruvate, water dikinase regulatory protein [Microbacterium sp. WCS2018Hpa-9]|uniref:pyruvate, water dikinase regulatory protein n=1 Tax=Microbacterium sp. WCS2018Hpa-9 TaxID=3073635 RepID=UPI00288A49BD|nr:pyruvate, water dikinase regulatory protein [Microbacterium sp. WCS2018Hpa-9]
MTTPSRPRMVFFVSDSTGITAETLGDALLANFPDFDFVRRTMSFVQSVKEAHQVVETIRRVAAEQEPPIVFFTVKDAEISRAFADVPAVRIDLLRGHLTDLEAALDATSSEGFGRYHSLADAERYFRRMKAIEYTIEHDDGQSYRALEHAEVIIIAPSRCGKTPTSMYLALQYGLRVANYPLTDDDLPHEDLPGRIAPYADRCFGLTTTPLRLSQIRHERRPNSHYASLPQCTAELRRAENLYRSTGIPFLNSATKSVEEMSAVVMQTLNLRK